MSDFPLNPVHAELMGRVKRDFRESKGAYPSLEYYHAMGLEPVVERINHVSSIVPGVMLYYPWIHEVLRVSTFSDDHTKAYQDYVRLRQAAFNHATCPTLLDAILAESTITNIAEIAGEYAKPQLQRLRDLTKNPNKYRLCAVPDKLLEPILDPGVTISMTFDTPNESDAPPVVFDMYTEMAFADSNDSHEATYSPGSPQYRQHRLGLRALRAAITPADYARTQYLISDVLAGL